MPENTVDFVFSQTALHWGLHAFPLSPSEGWLDKARFAVAHESLATVVNHTLTSLRPGGAAAFTLFGIEDEETVPSYVRLLDTYTGVWKSLIPDQTKLQQFISFPLHLCSRGGAEAVVLGNPLADDKASSLFTSLI